MGKHLIICGHGQGRNDYDPGASSRFGKEAELVRRLAATMQKYSTDIDYVTDKNVYDFGNIINYRGYSTITELHFNSFNGLAHGCEVLVHSNFSADSLDNALLNVLRKYFFNRGIKKRSDLYNMTVAAQNDMNYRLVEICFVDNENDMRAFNQNIENIAKEFVQVISGKVQNKVQVSKPQPKPQPKPQVSLKSLDEVAREVLNGRWGNGQARIQNLTSAGYNAKAVQDRVNQIKNVTPKKSVDQIAREVLNGAWGNGQDRINRLKKAGYNPQEVQKRVNELV